MRGYDAFTKLGTCVLLAASVGYAPVESRAQGVGNPAIRFPSADSLNREAERSRRNLERRLPTRAAQPEGPTIEGPTPEKPEKVEPGGPVFELKHVSFNRSAFIDRSELNAIARPHLGRKVDIATLYKIVGQVNALYAARGIITALATLPPQKIKDGQVQIKLTEGRLGQTKIAGAKTLDKDYVDARVQVPAGTIIDPNDLNRRITYFNQTNSAQIRALLQPGSSFGLTDIQYAVFEPATNTLQLFADNQGVETTGENQVGGFFRRYGLLGMDDRLTIYATYVQETLNANAAYNFPIDERGSRLGVSYSRGTFGIVNGPFVPLDVEGWSQSGSINYTTPVVINNRWFVQASLSTSIGEAETTYSEVAVSKTQNVEINPGLNFKYTGDGIVVEVAPSLAFVRSEARVLDIQRNIALIKGTGSFAFAPSNRVTVRSDFSWQVTGSKLLPGSQLFQAGGPTTVRGYTTNAVAGDDGYLANIEVHIRPSDVYKGINLYAFLDHGGVFSTAPDYRSLTSIGVGFEYAYNDFARLEVSVAHPLEQVLPDQDDVQVYGRLSISPQW